MAQEMQPEKNNSSLFPAMEEEVLKFWEKNKTFEKSVDKEAPQGPSNAAGKDYVFYDGPPFATGTPHYGHIVASLMKDVVPRYWTMRGYKVERRWGWDCHGLPIENIVEKEIGSKSKKDIEEIGVEKFNELCRSRVLGYVDEWKKVICRLGRWADMENSYRTMDLGFMESVWWVFKQLYDKGLIYEGYRSMHICPRCETTLSQSEVAEGYKMVKDLSCIAKFEIVNPAGSKSLTEALRAPNEKVFVLAWTTTPWTLIGNVALAVGKDIDYFLAGIRNLELGIRENYILAKERVEEVLKDKEYEILKEFKGNDLVGLEYKPVFDYYLDKNENLLNEAGDGKKIGVLMAVNKNKVLLGLRQYTKDKTKKDFKGAEVKDFLIAPGGRSETEEKFFETIVRELKEEINIENFAIKKYLGRIGGYLDGDVVEAFLISVDDIEQIKNNEPEKFKEWKFWEIDEIPKELLMRQSDLDLFKEAVHWNNGFKIYLADFVTTEDGTGVVHIAPAYGEDDLNLGKKFNLPFIQHVGMDGVIKKEAGEFAGMSVKPIGDHTKTDIEIIKYLARSGLLFAKEKYEHSYPHCWRCDTPLINYATSSWFVSIEKIKSKMLELAAQINWTPQYIKEGRFGNWLEGARDWSISRQRFWASVIPIWKCGGNQELGIRNQGDGCGEIRVMGSVQELEELSGEKISDIHKHIVDKITFKCAKCGGEMRRVPDVLDTWFDSGSMPYAQMHYPFENKEKFDKNFPARFIAEGVDQTRCWFYYLHTIAAGIKDSHAYQNVIVNGIVLAEDGRKMAKKLKNYPDPSFVFEKYSADALRYYLLTSPVMLAENLNFSEKGVEEVLRKVEMILWNVYKFYEMYNPPCPPCEGGQISPPTPLAKGGNEEKAPLRKGGAGGLSVESHNVLDKWILARLNELVKEVTENMDSYNLPKATRPIGEFINDLSTWYLRRSRDRFKGDNEDDKNAALSTMKFVLTELAKVMAPFTPFIAEQLWQKVAGFDFKDENRSVHLEGWPEQELRITNYELRILEEMGIVRKIVELGLAKRDEAGVKVRQPLNKFSIFSRNTAGQFSIDEYEKLIKDELNVKNVTIEKGTGELRVEIDTEITPELKQEGIKRELVRFINGMRKEAGMTINDRAVVFYETDNDLIKSAVEKFAEDIMNDTLSEKIIFGIDSSCAEDLSEGAELKKDVKIEGEAVKLGIGRV